MLLLITSSFPLVSTLIVVVQDLDASCWDYGKNLPSHLLGSRLSLLLFTLCQSTSFWLSNGPIFSGKVQVLHINTQDIDVQLVFVKEINHNSHDIVMTLSLCSASVGSFLTSLYNGGSITQRKTLNYMSKDFALKVMCAIC